MSEEHFGKVLGYRAWRVIVRDGRLTLFSAGNGSHEWVPGENKAECNPQAFSAYRTHENGWWGLAHHSPGRSDVCECGLYARNEPVGFQDSCVTGAVLAWGKTQAHPSGIRSEYMEPVVLTKPPIEDFEERFPEAAEMLRECATHYASVLVDARDLVKTAEKIAKPIPEELRAKFPKPESPEAGALATGATVGTFTTALQAQYNQASLSRQLYSTGIAMAKMEKAPKKSPWRTFKHRLAP